MQFEDVVTLNIKTTFVCIDLYTFIVMLRLLCVILYVNL
jgi:hypothetical protein